MIFFYNFIVRLFGAEKSTYKNKFGLYLQLLRGLSKAIFISLVVRSWCAVVHAKKRHTVPRLLQRFLNGSLICAFIGSF